MLFLQVSVWYVNNLRNSIKINSTTDQLEIALFFRAPSGEKNTIGNLVKETSYLLANVTCL